MTEDLTIVFLKSVLTSFIKLHTHTHSHLSCSQFQSDVFTKLLGLPMTICLTGE